MARREMWQGWQVQNMDAFLKEAPSKVPKNARSVTLPDLTAARARELSPRLQQFHVIRLQGACEAGAIPLLAGLPALSGIDLAVFERGAAEDESSRALVREVSALPRLTSLFATYLPARLLEELPRAAGLRWIALWEPSGMTESALSALGDLPELEELRVRAGSGPRLGMPAVSALVARGALRDVNLELDLASDAVEALLGTRGLRRASLSVPRPADDRLSVRVVGSESLELLELTATGHQARVADLPALEVLALNGFSALSLENLGRLPKFETYSAEELSVRRLPALWKVRLGVGPAALVVEGAPRLRLLDVRNGTVPVAGQEALRSALPGCELVFEPPAFGKRRRTAPKRKLGKKDWRHPRLGYDATSYALLIAGRRYDEDLTVAAAKELGGVAEAWSQQLGIHVAAVLPYDLGPGGALDGHDAVSPLVVGRVVAVVCADDGPSAAIAPERLEQALGEPLPAELWDEVMGVIGNDALSRQADALHLLAAGPTASALLAQGTVEDAEELAAGATFVRGQGSDQRPHSRGVAGRLVAEAGDDVTELIDLADLRAGQGATHLICRYD